MKARLRFAKLGEMQYIGHLDVMRYFQKLFRRSGLDVAYTQGFNPHQIMSFASPLGVGVTSIGEYLDVSLNSLGEYEPDEWIDVINSHSNGLIFVTSFEILPDNAKPSMSLLRAASYMAEFENGEDAKKTEDFFRGSESIMYVKETKKTKTEIDLKKEILILSPDYDAFNSGLRGYYQSDPEYEKKYIGDGKGGRVYMLCRAGSALNVKPEMLLGICVQDAGYLITRLNMFFEVA